MKLFVAKMIPSTTNIFNAVIVALQMYLVCSLTLFRIAEVLIYVSAKVAYGVRNTPLFKLT